MLARSGKLRTFRDNAALGVSLAVIGGFMNAGGLVVLGFVVSHVTGHWTNFGKELAAEHWLTALKFGGFVGSFLLGAITATLLIESHHTEHHLRSIYVRPLVVEWLLIAGFAAFGPTEPVAEASTLQMGFVAYLCFTLGLQNAMLSRLTGGTVRGTHLTGITTDLGIEIVKVYYLARARLNNVRLAREPDYRWADWFIEMRLVVFQEPAQRLRLFVYMLAAFLGGAIAGSFSFATWHARGAIPVLAALSILLGRELIELRREVVAERQEAGRHEAIASSVNITLPEPRMIAPPSPTTGPTLPPPSAPSALEPVPEARTPAP